MSDIGLLPTGFPYRRRGSCVPAAYLLSIRLPGASVVFGYVGPYQDQHTWIEFGGRIIDPTIRQFSWWKAGIAIERDVVGRFDQLETTSSFEKHYAMPWTDQGHAYRRFAKWIEPVLSRRLSA